jgi:hypothetical protein
LRQSPYSTPIHIERACIRPSGTSSANAIRDEFRSCLL